MNLISITRVLILAALFAQGAALTCFLRSGSTDTSNGTATSCTGFPYCYSFMSSSSQYAACGMTADSCPSSPSCVSCSTDYCNSVTPSSISCFVRTSSFDSDNNGTKVTCPTGISTCFSYSSMKSSDKYAGCGNCPNTPCITCNTSYCNARTPSSISCLYRDMMSLSTFGSNGIAISCSTGFSTCYSYTDERSTYGSCGTSNDGSSLTCGTDNCNTHLPSSISCFYRDRSYIYSGSTSNSNGTITPCSTGFATCFSYLVPIGGYFSSYSGCGVCSSSASAAYGCTTCNTSNCNYVPSTFTVSAQGTSAPTSSINSPQPLSSYVATTARTSGQPSSVNCFYSFGETTYTGRRKVTCDSGGSCYEYSFKSGFIDYFFAGCGNCTAYSIFGCRACGTDYCNSAAVTAGNCAVAAVVAGFVALVLM